MEKRRYPLIKKGQHLVTDIRTWGGIDAMKDKNIEISKQQIWCAGFKTWPHIFWYPAHPEVRAMAPPFKSGKAHEYFNPESRLTTNARSQKAVQLLPYSLGH